MVLMQRQKYIFLKSQKYDYLNRIKNSFFFWYHSILISLCMADAIEDVLD